MNVDRFRKVYSVLPESERKKPIVIIDEDVITWEKAFIEVTSGTSLGEKILEKLIKLDII